MRPYRLVDETLDDDEEYPRVVPIGARSRARSGPMTLGSQHEPGTPRETAVPPATGRTQQPATVHHPGLGRTHRWMLASFVIVCVGMVLGVLMVRIWDVASQAAADIPAEGAPAPAGQSSAQAAPLQATPPPAVPPTDPTPQAPAGPGAVTTEIQVLQPNYTVAPGETLGIIARRHGTTVEALASINNLENRNSLRVGQRLIIP